MGKKSQPAPPPPPDYTEAAKATAQSSLEAQRAATTANRVNQYNPWGSVEWYNEPGTDEWVQQTNLDPMLQQGLESQFATQTYLSDLSNQLMGKVGQSFEQPYDFPEQLGELDLGQMPQYQNLGGFEGGAMPEYGAAAEGMPGLDLSGQLGAMPELGFGAVEDIREAMMARNRPELERRRAARETQLAQQGITRGSEIEGTAQQQLGQAENDAYQQALLGAMGAYGDITGRQLQGRAQRAGELQAEYGAGMEGRRQREAELASRYGAGMQARGVAAGEHAARQAQANQAYQAGMGQRTQLMNEYTQRQQTRERQLQELAYQRNLPLQELNAVLRGQEVRGPSFQQYSTQQPGTATDFLGAAQGQYGANMNLYNAGVQGQGPGMLGGAAQGAAAGAALGPWGALAGGVIGGLSNA